VSNADALKKLCFDLKADLNNYAVVLAANIGGKPQVALMFDESVAQSKILKPKNHQRKNCSADKGWRWWTKNIGYGWSQDASNLPQVIEKVKSCFNEDEQAEGVFPLRKLGIPAHTVIASSDEDANYHSLRTNHQHLIMNG
jgi:hypothetical protein